MFFFLCFMFLTWMTSVFPRWQLCPVMSLERKMSWMPDASWMFSDCTGGTSVLLKSRLVSDAFCICVYFSIYWKMQHFMNLFTFKHKLFVLVSPLAGRTWTFSRPNIFSGRGARPSTQSHSLIWHAVTRGKLSSPYCTQISLAMMTPVCSEGKF